MRKITAIICILIFILLPTNVYADMGPKPSVVLNFYGLNNEKCYVTLLSKEDSSGPWSVYKNTEDSKRLMENMDENIWQSFVNYKDNDGYYFLQFFDECIEEKEGCELRRGAVYTRYKEWCGENGYRAEAAKNLNQEIEKRYKTARKRPNDGASSSTTPMVLDVAFTASEESKEDFAPLTS